MDIEQILTDPENQPSQFGTVPINDPRFVIFEMQPISKLDRSTDNTYLVLVEHPDCPGWYEKGWYNNDDHTWYDDAGRRIERHRFRVTQFAPWPTP